MAAKSLAFIAVLLASASEITAQDCNALGATMLSSCSEFAQALMQARPQLSGVSDQQIQSFINQAANKPAPGGACCSAAKAFNMQNPFCGCNSAVQKQAQAAYQATPADLQILGKANAYACGAQQPTACSG